MREKTTGAEKNARLADYRGKSTDDCRLRPPCANPAAGICFLKQRRLKLEQCALYCRHRKTGRYDVRGSDVRVSRPNPIQPRKKPDFHVIS